MPRFTDNGRRVLRGGSWYSDITDDFRAHYRYRVNPDKWDCDRGFRCVSPVDNVAAQRFLRIK